MTNKLIGISLACIEAAAVIVSMVSLTLECPLPPPRTLPQPRPLPVPSNISRPRPLPLARTLPRTRPRPRNTRPGLSIRINALTLAWALICCFSGGFQVLARRRLWASCCIRGGGLVYGHLRRQVCRLCIFQGICPPTWKSISADKRCRDEACRPALIIRGAWISGWSSHPDGSSPSPVMARSRRRLRN